MPNQNLVQALVTSLTDYRHVEGFAYWFIRELPISVVVLGNTIISVAQLQQLGFLLFWSGWCYLTLYKDQEKEV